MLAFEGVSHLEVKLGEVTGGQFLEMRKAAAKDAGCGNGCFGDVHI